VGDEQGDRVVMAGVAVNDDLPGHPITFGRPVTTLER